MSHDPTIQLISLALDAALMRQTAIASNIAHANSNDYRPQSVNFEQQLGQSDTLNTVRPYYEDSAIPLSMDQQLADNLKNATQFRALIKGLNHKFAIMKLAVQGNNQS